MNADRQGRLGTLINTYSPDVTPSPRYIGYYPMTQWTGAVGALASPALSVSTANVNTGSDLVTGVTSATWLVAGTAFRVRNTGTIPPGLSTSTVYYASKPTADQVKFHLTEADALAGTNAVDITGAGTANIVFYPALITDRSGQGNHQFICANINDSNAWSGAPRMGSASSGASDTSLCRLPAATLAARWVWPDDSLFMHVRGLFGTRVAGRSFWGCGVGSPAADGPRLAVDSSDTNKLRLILYHLGNGTAVTVGTSAADACSESVEHSIALLLNGPARTASVWVDGVADLTLTDVSVSSVASMAITTDLRLGGAANNNAQAAFWRDYHLLAFDGSPPSDIGDIAAYLASTLYARLRDVDA